ncbi:Adenosyl-chloride synthase [Acaryochloris thomasi RCC1774]|uniref:Adenosyl-chloride synthase n=1 Tax=Acaryochloris thomasi RCC1774 TaxID=1764569 RepID=A0A2W1JN10_9CYAN|nr:SAM-dependent chlorinase/fluorinase [Acaryochloris thomasi]PZD74708.1 Adenosyl-chloride synthase [Acaryochloris thomasi RCC1774]
MSSPLITLTTDFGLTDVYVGVMKGVIAQVNPELSVIDLNHAIPPQNIALASFQLGNAYPYFSANTVHVVVVDPGVGSSRRAIAFQTDAGFFVGPDNGVFSSALQTAHTVTAVELNQPQYWRTGNPSATFHGRDIFAPVAAHLATGFPLVAMGAALDPQQLVQLNHIPPQQSEQWVMGTIQAIDYFGNLITNIPAAAIPSDWTVKIGEHLVPEGTTYGSVLPGQAVSLVGSHGWLEVAVNGGNAQAQLQSQVGDRILMLITN